MPQQGIAPRLAYLLRDPNTNAVVVPDLYHLHQSTWTVRALLAGYPGSTTIGDFTIPLPPPYSEEFGRYQAQYNAILNAANKGIGLKVEGYNGSVNASAPVLSGVITKMDLPLDGPWILSGADTLYWLQQSQIVPFHDLSVPHLLSEVGVKAFLGTQEAQWDDDFSGGSSPLGSNYTQTPGGGFSISTDPLFGQPAILTTTAGDLLTTNTSWASAVFCSLAQASMVTAHAVLVGGTDTTASTTLGILALSDTTATNSYLIQAAMRQHTGGGGTGLYDIDVTLWASLGAGFVLQASASSVLTNVVSPFPLELTAIFCGKSNGPSLADTLQVRCLVNGKDAGISMNQGFPSDPGKIGVRVGWNPGGSPAVYVNRLTFKAATNQLVFPGGSLNWGTNRFAAGSITASPANFTYGVTGQSQTHLDMLLASAAFDGYSIRKNAEAGAKADSIDYGPSPGNDYSSAVVFEERVNVLAQGTTFQNVAEIYSTDAKINAIPFGDSGGTVTWGRLASAGDMVLTDTVSDVGMPGFALLFAAGKAITNRKAAPLAATQVTVIRTADMLRAANGWGPREWDFVQVHMPTYGILHQKAQIVGYTVDEATATSTYYLTQFPESQLPQNALQRLVRSADYISATYAKR